MSESFFDSIGEALDAQHTADAEQADAPKFDPKQGESLNGVFLKAEAFTKGKYDATVLLTFRNVGDEAVGGIEAGASGVLFCPTVLRRKLFEASPAMGTPFALRFEGSVQPSGGGNAYKDWTLLTSYQKTSNMDEVDEPLWRKIQSVVDADEVPRTSTPSDSSDDGTWKF